MRERTLGKMVEFLVVVWFCVFFVGTFILIPLVIFVSRWFAVVLFVGMLGIPLLIGGLLVELYEYKVKRKKLVNQVGGVIEKL